MQQLLELIENMSEYVNQRLPGIEFYTSDSGSLFSGKGDDSPVKVENGKEITSWENEDSAYLLDNVFNFLGGLLQDSGQWGTDVIQKISFKSWIKLLTLRNAPWDYSMSNGIVSFMGILKYFDDEKENMAYLLLLKNWTRPLNWIPYYLISNTREKCHILKPLNLNKLLSFYKI